MKTLYLNCTDNEISFNKKNYLLRAANRLGMTNILDGTGNPNPMDYVLNIEPFVFIQGNKWTGMWAIDTLVENRTFHENIQKIDTVFIAGTTQRKIGVHFDPSKEVVLFQACDPDLHKPMPEIEKEFDFVICGTNGGAKYHERWFLLDLLAQKYHGKDLGKNIHATKYITEYNRAKVQFIRSMSVGGKETVVNGGLRLVGSEGEIAQRFFECLAIGPVLTNYVSDLELTGLIENEDYLAYRTDEELIQKMDLLLNNTDYRNSIAKNGREKALLYHTYEHRLMSIINMIKEWELKHA